MSQIQIVIDSTAYLTREEAIENKIQVVPLAVHFQGKDFQEGFLDEIGDYFIRLSESKDFPTTSQPPVGAFVEVFRKALEEGKEVVALIFSSELSGTYHSAVMAANMVDPEKITVIDTRTSVGNLKYMALQAAGMARGGRSRREITEFVEDQKSKMDVYLTVGSLEYLRRGGRLNNAQAFLGSILNIKPIIQLKDGKLIGIEKTRGKKKAIESMLNKVPGQIKNIYVLHILNEEEAIDVAEKLREKYPDARVLIEEMGPVIGSHLGPDSIGITYTW